MEIQFVGNLPGGVRGDMDAFTRELEKHPWGGVVEGRFVFAEPHPGGILPAMIDTLAKWMPADAYRQWLLDQRGRPVATGGKTFVAKDGVVTVVVLPIENCNDLRGIAAHEIAEAAHLADQISEGWIEPTTARELNGIVLFDEYVVERARTEIFNTLGFSPGVLDHPNLVSQIETISQAMPDTRADPPPSEFWVYWTNMARVWTMNAGRRAAGSAVAEVEAERWASHPLIAEQGWKPVTEAMDDLYGQPGEDRHRLVEETADRVWDPIEQYGRDIWVSNAL